MYIAPKDRRQTQETAPYGFTPYDGEIGMKMALRHEINYQKPNKMTIYLHIADLTNFSVKFYIDNKYVGMTKKSTKDGQFMYDSKEGKGYITYYKQVKLITKKVPKSIKNKIKKHHKAYKKYSKKSKKYKLKHDAPDLPVMTVKAIIIPHDKANYKETTIIWKNYQIGQM
jgi:hypothetical protein